MVLVMAVASILSLIGGHQGTCCRTFFVLLLVSVRVLLIVMRIKMVRVMMSLKLLLLLMWVMLWSPTGHVHVVVWSLGIIRWARATSIVAGSIAMRSERRRQRREAQRS